MFIERLVNQTNAPLAERVLHFTSERHKLIAQNMANVDTPGYRQKDLSPAKFFAMLRQRAAEKREGPPGRTTFSDIDAELEHPTRGILFHDGNNRSMEHLVSDQAKNGMMYTMAIEILRKQFSSMQMALKERIA